MWAVRDFVRNLLMCAQSFNNLYALFRTVKFVNFHLSFIGHQSVWACVSEMWRWLQLSESILPGKIVLFGMWVWSTRLVMGTELHTKFSGNFHIYFTPHITQQFANMHVLHFQGNNNIVLFFILINIFTFKFYRLAI